MTEQDNWLDAQKGSPLPSTQGGATGYFSAPEKHLDPALFSDDDRLYGDVRANLIKPLVSFFQRDLRLNSPLSWLKLWLAGSGITYQWSANRGNGDLDVLLGIDRSRFDNANPEFQFFGDDQLADYFNRAMKSDLWPMTANSNIGGKTFEVTYFYNAGTGDDISNINPYAAYSVTSDAWVVRPPAESAATHKFPVAWHEQTDMDLSAAQHFTERYGHYFNQLAASQPGSPGHVNAGTALNVITSQAQALLNDIHSGRKLAFQGGGKGYLDYHNFRWQAAKGNGTIKSLSEMTGVRDRSVEKLPGANELIERAMLYRRNG